nr:hypothetical protein [uncultured Flavobacterium sp.]
MKKFKFLTSLAFFAAILFTSCGDTEPLDPAIVTNNGGGDNGGGNGTPSGDYWPTAINNQWMLVQNGTALPPMKMISTDNFGGATYYKFSPQSSGSTATNVTTWLNKSGGVYKLKQGDVNINAGGFTGTQTGYEMVLLKDNIAVNQTWTGTYNQTTTYTGIPAITQTTNYTGKILEKGITVTVEGETYTDVIKMNMLQETSMTGSLSIVNTEYWFAKNVGPIKIITYSGSGTYTSVLTDYTLY